MNNIKAYYMFGFIKLHKFEYIVVFILTLLEIKNE